MSALSLSDKCRLLAGATTWKTVAFPDAGVPAIKMSDGPNGVRGEGFGTTGTKGVVVPSGITLGATWDADLVGRIGDLLGREARRRGAHVLLAPTVNLHRTPVGGRTFECYSEDPELSGELAAAYIRGVQSHDVAVTVKHFVCNDTEIERMTVDVDVDARPLHELDLRPFERAVVEGGAWGVMSAYNRLGGEHCAEHRDLLTGILRERWGFDGVVVSDWFGVHHTVEAANAGLNVEMPAPVRVYGQRLEEAVERGEVAHVQLDALVRDVLVLADRVHADERDADQPEQSVDDPEERALTRAAAVAGTVLLRNEPVGGRPVLPIDPSALGRVAVLGPNATVDRSMGGGSASLAPFAHRSFLRALTDRIGPDTEAGVEIVHEPGVRIDKLTPIPPGSRLRRPDGGQGLQVSYVNGPDWDGEVVLETPTPSSLIRFFGSTPDGVDPSSFSGTVRGSFVPEVDGTHTIGIVATGPVRATAGTGDAAVTVVDDPDGALPRSEEFFGYGSVEVLADVECVAGEAVPLEIKFAAGGGFAALRVGIRHPDPPDLFERAVAAAADADVAVVVVGTNDEWETEGTDRTTMDLPGGQDALVRAVARANPDTVVIVNAGSPVTMDFATGDDAAPAILTPFFAGQEQAEGLVDVLLGLADPGGRLPTTIPVRLEDHPAYLTHRPDHDQRGRGVQRYGEGLFIGYRWYDARRLATRFPFGHGLSYGSAEWGPPTASTTALTEDDPELDVTVPLTARGDRPATVVVQCYVGGGPAGTTRPPKELRTWDKVVVEPGTPAHAVLRLRREMFRRWDTGVGDWVIDPGTYDVVIAASAEDERSRLQVRVD